MPNAATSAPMPFATNSSPLYLASPKDSGASTKWMIPVARMAAIASHFSVGEGAVIDVTSRLLGGHQGKSRNRDNLSPCGLLVASHRHRLDNPGWRLSLELARLRGFV